jgi:hypothetical protein
LEATPLLPDNLLIGRSVPRFAVGVCAYVPTLLLHAKGSAYKEEFNRSIMNHRVAVSDHYPILFKIEAAGSAQLSPSSTSMSAPTSGPATTAPATATPVSAASGVSQHQGGGAAAQCSIAKRDKRV